MCVRGYVLYIHLFSPESIAARRHTYLFSSSLKYVCTTIASEKSPPRGGVQPDRPLSVVSHSLPFSYFSSCHIWLAGDILWLCMEVCKYLYICTVQYALASAWMQLSFLVRSNLVQIANLDNTVYNIIVSVSEWHFLKFLICLLEISCGLTQQQPHTPSRYGYATTNSTDPNHNRHPLMMGSKELLYTDSLNQLCFGMRGAGVGR